MMRDTYTLDDFYSPDWDDKEPYSTGGGIELSHVDSLHEGAQREVISLGGKVSPEFVAYISLDAYSFTIHIYAVNSRTGNGEIIDTVTPSFVVLGTTFDGIREVHACASLHCIPREIADQMIWADRYCFARGWVL
jgi:hypothetical protein